MRELSPVPAHWEAEYDWVWTHCASAVMTLPRWAFARLRFYEVTVEEGTFRFHGRDLTGLWAGNRIYLVSAAVTQVPPWVLRHELLHAQLGVGTHPPVFAFCDQRTMAEAG